jgi:hypothetical protein
MNLRFHKKKTIAFVSDIFSAAYMFICTSVLMFKCFCYFPQMQTITMYVKVETTTLHSTYKALKPFNLGGGVQTYNSEKVAMTIAYIHKYTNTLIIPYFVCFV